MNNKIYKNIIKAKDNDTAIINTAIKLAYDECSVMKKTTIHQRSQVGKAYSTATHKRNNSFTREGKHVKFKNKPSIATYQQHDNTPMVTYDSGADRHYLGQNDRTKLGLQILRISDKKVVVSNGGACNGKYVTSLTLLQLSSKAAEADTFEEFPTSLMIVGKTADDGNVSIFTKDGVIIHKEEYVLITCQKNPILIGKRDERGRYRIPLTQDHGQWQPHRPTKAARSQLQLTHSVYDLPSNEEAINWMHAVCVYPVKYTWITATKTFNYVGWTMLTKRNVARY